MIKKIISLMLVVMLSFSFTAELKIGTVYAAETIAETVKLELGTPLEVSLDGYNTNHYCEFVPEESGWYKFYSTGNCSVGGKIYGTTVQELLAESDNYQKDFFGQYVISGNFKIIHYFEAGQKYSLYSSRIENKGTYSVAVEKVPDATAITITDQEELNIGIGQEYALELCYTPEDSSREKVTWVSDNTDVVFVDENGICHFKALGTANLTATTESGLTDSVVVNVVNYQEILLNAEEEYKYIGGESTVTYTFTPEETGKYAFSVKTDSGLVQGVAVTAAIYDSEFSLITESEKRDTEVIVYCNMNAGEHYYLSYTDYSDHIYATAVAKVIKIGGVSNVNSDGIDTTDELWQENESIALDSINEIQLNEEKQVGIAFEKAKSVHKFIPAEDGEYKFTSDGNENVAFAVLDDSFNSISSGKTPFRMKLEAGKTYIVTSCISASVYSGLGEYIIKINKLPKAEKLEITNGENLVGNIGQQIDLIVGTTPEESESEELVWTSSDKYVVSVEDGRISLNKIGKATITVTNESGLSDSIEVEVAHYPEIKLGETKVLTSDTKEVSFTFIPEESGVYKFTAKSENAEMLLNGKVTKVSSKPEATIAGSQVINLDYYFEAGEIYYITVGATRAEALGEMEYSIQKDIATTKVGDVNQDGIIDAEDALLVLKHAAKLETIADDIIPVADVTQDGAVNSEDALEILKYAAILIRDFN